MSQFSPMKPYENLGIYDAPGTVVSQLLDGEGSFRTIANTFLRPNKLTPDERSGLAEKLLRPEATGIEKAVVGVITNPWVWLMALTGPVGHKALLEGKSLFAVKEGVASQAKNYMGWMSNMLNPLQNTEGTASTAIVTGLNQVLEKMGVEAGTHMEPFTRALLTKMNKMAGWKEGQELKIVSLSPENYKKGTAEWKIVKDWAIGSSGRTHRLGETFEEVVPEVRMSYEVKKPDGSVRVVGKEQGERYQTPQVVMAKRDLDLQMRANGERAAAEEWYSGAVDKARYGDLGKYKKEVLEEIGDLQHETVPKTIVRQAKMDPAAIDSLLHPFGEEGERFLRESDWRQKFEFMRYAGDEKHFVETTIRDANGMVLRVGERKFDPRKIGAVADSMGRFVSESENGISALGKGGTTLQGKEALMSMLGVERWTAAHALDPVARNKYLMGEFEKLLPGDDWQHYHMSRNTFDPVEIMQNGRYVRPPSVDPKAKGNLHEATNMEFAPWSSSTVQNKRVLPLTEREIVLDPSQFDGYEWVLNQDGQKEMKRTLERAQKLYDEDNGKVILGLRLDHEQSYQRYVRDMHIGTAHDTMEATPAMLRADADSIKNIPEERRGLWTRVGGEKIKIGQALENAPPVTATGIEGELQQVGKDYSRHVSPGALLDRLYMGQHPSRRDYIRDVLVPSALNNSGPEFMALYNSQMQAKAAAQWFGESWIGKTIEKFGPRGQDFIKGVKEFADPNVKGKHVDWSSGTAKWFYTTHLGLNLSSMVMNMTQPLLLAGSIGRLDDVLGAYKDAFMEMGTYAEKRAGMGKVFIDPATKRRAMAESFKHMDVMGVGPDMDKMLDWQMKAAPGGGAKVRELMMKGFEKTEWFNRATASHLYERVMKRQGLTAATNPHYMTDMHRFVMETQFGSNAMNTPELFTKGVLGNPLMRQFFTFPLRSAVGSFYVFPRMGEQDYWKGLANLTFRQMGMSAAVYEAGKGLFGADLSRGLYAGAATDIVGGGKALDGRGSDWLPVPPIVDVPLGMVRGIVQGDATLLANSVARTIPGGVAVNRMLGMSPEWSALPGLQRNLQKQFVDWNTPTPEGLVPVYKGDGTLIDYRSPSSIVLKSFGVDLGAWEAKGGIDAYLVAQRDEILQYRQEYLRAMGANELGRASQIQGDFAKRFKGIPLTVNQAQVKAYLNARTTARTERVLDRVPPEVRGAYQQMVAASGAAGNVDREALVAQATARMRDPSREGAVGDPRVQEILARQAQVGGASTQGTGPFNTFQGFR